MTDTNDTIAKTTNPNRDERDPVVTFFAKLSTGQVALIAVFATIMLFVSGLTIGGAIADLGF